MTLAEAVAQFEAQFATVIDGQPCATHTNGYSYDVIKTDGSHRTEDGAAQAWIDAMDRYHESSGGRVLVWRIRPELARTKRGAAKFMVYSRLLIVSQEEKAA